LLKFWDPAEHPRTDTPPNPGWFAPVGGATEAATVVPVLGEHEVVGSVQSGRNSAASVARDRSIQEAQFIPLLETPPVEIFSRVPTTPIDELPQGSAGGPGAGARFPRSFNEQNRQQNRNCYLCGRPTSREPGPDQYNGDHIIPRAQGGNDSPENIGTTCRTCNLQKGNQTPQQYVPRFYFDPLRDIVPLEGDT
jgi:hypothetical protein